MTLSRTSISLGQLRVGRRIADSLKVTSNGDTTAITISSSGMKTGTRFSSYPTTSNRSINPGSSEIDSVIFTPNARGTFNDSLIFNTNSDTVPQRRMAVYVSGQGIQAIFNSTNGTTLSFGNVRPGRTAQRTFAFSNTGDDTMYLQTPSTVGIGLYTIVYSPANLTFPPNRADSVVVRFAPMTGPIFDTEQLIFTASNGVSTPTVTMIGKSTLPQIQISNSSNLGAIRVGQTLQGAVFFNNIGSDTLHVSNASLTQTSTRFSLGTYDHTVIPGANGTVHLSYTPNAEKIDTATLHFSTDDPTDSAVAITLNANGVLPHMAVAEKGKTVSLGLVTVNSTTTANISVANTGGADLTLTSVTAGPAPFSLKASPNVVSAGADSTIIVRFSPTVTGVFNGKLVIRGDDANNPSDTVYLTGSGIAEVASDTQAVLFSDTGTTTLPFSGDSSGYRVHRIDFVNNSSISLVIVGAALTSSNTHFSISQLLPGIPDTVKSGAKFSMIVHFTGDTSGTVYRDTIVLTIDHALTSYYVYLNGNSFGIGPVQAQEASDTQAVLFNSTGTMNVTLSGDSARYRAHRIDFVNNSGVSLVIAGAALTTSNNRFSISQLLPGVPATVKPGATFSMIVHFLGDTSGTVYLDTVVLTIDHALTSFYVYLIGNSFVAAKSGVSLMSVSAPSDVRIYPNPFSQRSTIRFTTDERGAAQVRVVNLLGEEVARVFSGELEAGEHTFTWDANGAAAGTYFCIVRSNDRVTRAAMVLER
jgi:hypothetical protein